MFLRKEVFIYNYTTVIVLCCRDLSVVLTCLYCCFICLSKIKQINCYCTEFVCWEREREKFLSDKNLKKSSTFAFNGTQCTYRLIVTVTNLLANVLELEKSFKSWFDIMVWFFFLAKYSLRKWWFWNYPGYEVYPD